MKKTRFVGALAAMMFVSIAAIAPSPARAGVFVSAGCVGGGYWGGGYWGGGFVAPAYPVFVPPPIVTAPIVYRPVYRVAYPAYPVYYPSYRVVYPSPVYYGWAAPAYYPRSYGFGFSFGYSRGARWGGWGYYHGSRYHHRH